MPLGQLGNPVVFVGRQQSLEDGPITVVTHGLRGSAPVLARALDYAAEWRRDVRVVCLPPGAGHLSAGQIAAYEAALFDTLAEFRSPHPGVRITARVAATAAALSGPALSAGALLVIGSRRGGTLAAVVQRRRVRRLIRAGRTAVCVVPTSG